MTVSISFQSAPGGEAGGNRSTTAASSLSTGFDPPPAVRPGETYQATTPVSQQSFQSAPGGEAGGNLRRAVIAQPPVCFNPPPAVRPGETCLAVPFQNNRTVSIRPRR